MIGLVLIACLHVQQAGLTIVDEDGQVHAISPADLAKMPRRTIKAAIHDAPAAEYEGVQLADLLERAGVVLGKDLRGRRLANTVLVEAADGYRVALGIAEVDPATTDKVVLLVDRKDGQPLPEKEGPYRLIIPDEKRPIRWIRMVKQIRVQPPADSPAGSNVAPASNDPSPAGGKAAPAAEPARH